MSDEDYHTLDAFVKAVLGRVGSGESDVGSAHADIMQPLTAWDKGNLIEFGPWMRARLEEWSD